jgi:acetylornithine deacetylase/succinyl-diaminopimelate desuccinylase-like protein
MLATDGDLPVNVRFLIEGEEEIGSGSLAPFIRENRERLACDVVLISDTGMIAPNLPTLTYGLRGIAAMELRVLGPSSDLHSGLFGGAIMNPLTALARVLASLHHENGRVAVPGFYDQVRPLELWERRMWENLPYGDAQLLAVTGAADLFGESGYSAVERLWARPTAEVNGVGGGFQGTGSKTVIPREAMAKLTFRLVPDQNPELILDLVEAYLRERCPLGTRIEITRGHTARPYATDPKGAWGVVAGRALEATFGTAPVMIREGGSIPIVDVFRQELGVDTLLLGLALPDCGAHGPNENFPVEHFHAGMRLGRNFLAEAVALARGAGAV